MPDNIQYLLREFGPPLVFGVVFALAFFYLRTRGTKIGSIEDFDKLVRNGKPTVVEFYSNT